MKSIIVKNLMIQFDSFDNDADKFTAYKTLENINSVLQEQFPDICPQFFVNAIDDTDIEIVSHEVSDDE